MSISLMQLSRAIKLVLVFLVLAGFSGYAQQGPLNKKMTIRFSGVSIQEALTMLTADHTLPLSFDSSILPADKKITKHFSKTPVASILEFLLSGTGLSYKLLYREIIILPIEKSESTLNGHITDAETGEDLIGAAVFIESVRQGVNSNNYGFYSLTIPSGPYEVIVSHVGYVNRRLNLDLEFPTHIQNIRMEKQVNRLEEIVVKPVSTEDSITFPGPGHTLHWEVLRDQASFKGEADVIKALQMQNGITGLTEGSSQLFIRGGNKDQNLILLDEAIVYNPAHLFGLTSVFNPDALKNIQVYTGAMPANFGGRLSSVIDARMADGDDKNFHLKGGVSFLAARLSAEGPIVKDKGSFLFAARRSLTNLLSKDLELFDLRPAYYDLNFKINYKFGPADRVFYSAYLGRDRVNSTNGYFNKWGNQTSTLRWNHIFSPKLFMNLSGIYSNYRNQLNINADAASGVDRWITGIRDATLKGDFSYYHQPNSQFDFGFSSILHLFIPGETNHSIYTDIPRARAGEYAVYLSHKLNIGNRLMFLYGLRTSIFQNISTPRIYLIDGFPESFDFQEVVRGGYTTFIKPEPRLMVQYKLRPLSYLQFSYNRNYQYLQLIQNDELAFSSLESWIPSNPNIRPQRSDHFSLEYKGRFSFGTLSIAGYYKRMVNQLELFDHGQLISNPLVEALLVPGKADAYGLELMFSKDIGRFKGTFFYTWSRVFHTFDLINNGKKFPANYDIPHAAKLDLSYRFSEQLSLHSFMSVSSGRPLNFPIGYFIQKGLKVPIYGDRNASGRMPTYHRLDLSLHWDPPFANRNKKHWASSFNIGVYNVYNRKNPIIFKIDQNRPEDLQFNQQAFAGRTFGIGYNFRF